MRAFIAIELPEILKDEVAGIARQLASVIKGRFIPRSNYHVTIAFLGDIPEDALGDVINAMEIACLGSVSGIGREGKHVAVDALESSGPDNYSGDEREDEPQDEPQDGSQEGPQVILRPDGIGKFGRSSNATLWLGLAKDPGLMRLAFDIREALVDHDISFDSKGFLPHITLARHAQIPKGPLSELTFPLEVKARKVTLFKSVLSKDGAHYESLHTIEL